MRNTIVNAIGWVGVAAFFLAIAAFCFLAMSAGLTLVLSAMDLHAESYVAAKLAYGFFGAFLAAFFAALLIFIIVRVIGTTGKKPAR